MGDDDIDARLDALRGTGRYVSLETGGAFGPRRLGGVIEDVGDALVLVQELKEFHRSGFVLLRRSEIAAVIESEVERLFARMIAAEGLTEELRAPLPLDLDAWSDCLRDLRRLYGAVLLECVAGGGLILYVGRIVRVSRDAVWLRCVTVEGALEREALEVPLDEITRVIFDDRYSVFFDRHASDEGLH
ncbi:MAG: hypothetical protein R3A48_16810 [Polyangiales bacterium]